MRRLFQRVLLKFLEDVFEHDTNDQLVKGFNRYKVKPPKPVIEFDGGRNGQAVSGVLFKAGFMEEGDTKIQVFVIGPQDDFIGGTFVDLEKP